jgi:hypothetical protein
MLSHDRQENFSRTCWITFARTGPWRPGFPVRDHLPPARDQLQRLRHILADLVQGPAAARTGRRRGIDNALTWQVLGHRPPCRLAPLEPLHLHLRVRGGSRCHLRPGLRLRRILFQVG